MASVSVVALTGRRSPHGERGLKLPVSLTLTMPGLSLPSRGAWIEIYIEKLSYHVSLSLPSRGAWIEIGPVFQCRQSFRSLPSRGAWIEIASASAPSGAKGESLPSRGAWIEIA